MIKKEDFLEFFKILKEDSKDCIVVVEGKKDKKALEEFGIRNIIILRKPLYMVVEHIVKSERDCIILTDLDKKGKELYGKLASSLKHFGVRVDDKAREFLFKTKIRQIEGIKRYMERLE